MTWDKIVVNLLGLALIAFIVWFFWLVKAKGVKAAFTSTGYQEQMVLVKGGYPPDVIVVERGKRPDWVPMGLTLTVWVCTLPLAFLLIMPWFGVRVAIVTALVLLVVTAIVCWILCAASRVELGRSSEER